MKTTLILAVIAAAIMPNRSFAQDETEMDAMFQAFTRLDSVVKATRTTVNNQDGAYTGRALGQAAQAFADQQTWNAILASTSGDTIAAKINPAWVAYQSGRTSPEVRQASGRQFVSALMQGAKNGNSATSRVQALERRIARLEGDLRKVAHHAASAANKDNDWRKERKPSVQWLASY